MEELLIGYRGPVECLGKHDIEVKKGKGRDQEVRLVEPAEMHGPDPLPFKQKDSGQDHCQQQNKRYCRQVSLHKIHLSPFVAHRRLPGVSPARTVFQHQAARLQGSWTAILTLPARGGGPAD